MELLYSAPCLKYYSAGDADLHSKKQGIRGEGEEKVSWTLSSQMCYIHLYKWYVMQLLLEITWIHLETNYI
jgi:hypothetical protein